MRAKTVHRWMLAGTAVLAMLLTACGDDVASGTVRITAADYRFEGVPKEAEAGTRLTLVNESTKELHELVALKVPANEERSAAELVKLPTDQLERLFQGPPTAVLLAPPSKGPQIQAVGDGTLREKGRYLFVCFIPTGADPNAYLAAAQAGGEGPPAVAGGAPHVAEGMWAEIKVV